MKDVTIKKDKFEKGTYNVHATRNNNICSERVGKVQKDPDTGLWSYSLRCIDSEHEVWLLGLEFSLGMMYLEPEGAYKKRQEAVDEMVAEFAARYVHQRPVAFRSIKREWELEKLKGQAKVTIEYWESGSTYALFEKDWRHDLIALGQPIYLQRLVERLQLTLVEDASVKKETLEPADEEQIEELFDLLNERDPKPSASVGEVTSILEVRNYTILFSFADIEEMAAQKYPSLNNFSVPLDGGGVVIDTGGEKPQMAIFSEDLASYLKTAEADSIIQTLANANALEWENL